MDKQVTSGQFIKNTRKVIGAEAEKPQTITVSFVTLIKLSPIYLKKPVKQYCGRTSPKAYSDFYHAQQAIIWLLHKYHAVVHRYFEAD
jgi:hypothetical protein